MGQGLQAHNAAEKPAPSTFGTTGIFARWTEARARRGGASSRRGTKGALVDELVGVVAVLLGGVFIVSPLVTLYLVLDLRKRNARLERQIAELEQRGARADWWIGELARRAEQTRGEADRAE